MFTKHFTDESYRLLDRSHSLLACGEPADSHRQPAYATRREFLAKSGAGFGAVALAGLMSNTAASSNPLSAKKPHFVPTAKRVIFLFMEGGPSHLDLFDRKPLLQELAGKTIPAPDVPPCEVVP